MTPLNVYIPAWTYAVLDVLMWGYVIVFGPVLAFGIFEVYFDSNGGPARRLWKYIGHKEEE